MSRFCTACGGALSGGARFCRACGAAVSTGSAEPEPETTAAELDQQLYGLTADAPTEATASDRSAARSTAVTRSESPGRGPFVAVLAVVAVAMLAGGGFGAYLVLGGDDDSASEASWSSGSWVDDRDDVETGSHTTTDQVGGDDGGNRTDVTDGTPLGPEIDAGLYVQLGSFLGDGATREAERLGAAGVDAFVVDSNGVAELMPGFRVVVAGPLESDRDQDRVIRAGRGADVGGIPKTLTPAVEGASPGVVGGARFGGSLTKAGRDVELDMAFATDGRSATIRYAEPRCSGELSLAEAAGAVLVYDEEIVAGACQAGGSWTVKPADGELRATWTNAASGDFGTGALSGL